MMPAGVLEGHRRVIVIGLGKVTGKATAEALLDLGAQVHVTEAIEDDSHLVTAAALRELGAEVTFGDHDAGLLDWADLVIPSPGVPPSNPLIAGALRRGMPVWSEIELGSRLVSGPIFAVTGTNGKTTTTTLLASVLEVAGLPAAAVGNIGIPLVEAARTCPAGTVFVCEVSSQQLAFVDRFRPQIAIVLNVADDHYDWHSGHEQYLKAKARIVANQDETDLLVMKFDDRGCAAIGSQTQASIAAFGLESPAQIRKSIRQNLDRDAWAAAGIEGDQLVISGPEGSSPLVSLSDIRVKGAHNVENVLAAGLAAIKAGVDLKTIAEAVKVFEGLPHRMADAGEHAGVRFIDDSKATNPHATLRALAGLHDVILIAGGLARGLDFSVLREAGPALKAIIVMGETAEELESIFSDLECRRAEVVEDAVRIARELAQPGDTVLLSPACASWDQYSSYGERGDRFVKAVMNS